MPAISWRERIGAGKAEPQQGRGASMGGVMVEEARGGTWVG